jgi:hypothetical protein
MKLKESSLRSWFSRWGYKKPASKPAPKAVAKPVKETKPKPVKSAKVVKVKPEATAKPDSGAVATAG